MDYCAGVDLGGTSIKTGLFTTEGKLVDKKEIPTRIEGGLNVIFSDIAEAVKQLSDKNNATGKLCGAGIGVPGPVQEDGYVETCANLNLQDFRPADVLSDLLDGINVRAANDADAAALGEMWQGGGKGCANLVAVTLGTGVGGGIIADSKIVFGFRGMGGEIGHIPLNSDEKELCNCGGIGCLDQVSSATGVVRYAGFELEKSDSPSVLRNYNILSAKDILQAAKSGDELAGKTVDYCMSYLGQCLSIVGHIVDPEIFVIGGGLSNAGTYLLDIIFKHYKKHQHLVKKTAKFSLAELGNDAGIYGAARLALGS